MVLVVGMGIIIAEFKDRGDNDHCSMMLNMTSEVLSNFSPRG